MIEIEKTKIEIVEIDPNNVNVIRVPVKEVVEVGVVGPQGPAGAPGVSGAAAASYVHDQTVPAATWVVEHDLGMYPNVTVVDSAGSLIEGDVTYDNNNQITLNFSGAFSGKAYIS
jgi:hypothetical protein